MDNGEIGGRFTSGELKVASFWVRNRERIQRLTYIFVGGLCVLFWGYVIVGLLDAYVISYPREARMTRQIALNQQLLASLDTARPENIAISDVMVLPTTDNRFDMMVELQNPNERWWVEFQYHFRLSGEDTPQRTGYVLPSSKQIVTELGYTPTTRGGASATLIIDAIRWHRIDTEFVGTKYDQFAQNRFNVSFEDVSYDTGIVLGSTRVGQTSFVLNNQSSYGFWNMDVIVRLYRGSSIIAINKITLSTISPGEKRPVQMVWLETIPSVTRTEIIPQVNLLDKAVYLPTNYFK